MRPLGVTVEGFSAYRGKQTISFVDVEFFSLSGPTGSGKSSLVDAMIFALYGRVPRLGARAVAPVITAGADRARVSLDFEVGGEAYVVSRVAERTDSGASVREARLEKIDGTPIASGAGEVTRDVEQLLRLRFDDFTKTVVLPQGEFARFLNAGSTERRELLRDLLGLDIYARVRELANERRSEASGRAGSARSQLEALELPAVGEVEETRGRLDLLQQLSGTIGERIDEIARVEAELSSGETRIQNFEDALSRLGEISPPAHLEELDVRLVTAREVETAAEEALQAKRREIESLRAAIDEFPGREAIESTRIAHEEVASIEERLETLDLDTARAAVDGAVESLQRHEAVFVDAEEAASRARVSHSAHAVAETLVAGEPCPVCAQTVTSVPQTGLPPELAGLDAAVAEAREAVVSSRERVQSSRSKLTELETLAAELRNRRGSLAERLEGAPSPAELDQAEAEVDRLAEAMEGVRSRIGDLETALRGARRDHEDAAEAVRSVERALGLARDTVSDLKPPYPDGDDPVVRWKEFLVWRDLQCEELAAGKRSQIADLEQVRERVADLGEKLIQDLLEAGVPAERPYDVAVTREVEKARGALSRLEELVERSESLRTQLDEATRIEAVAAALSNHLRANGFEQWLMAGALADLVLGANQLLGQLSGGGYSLHSDESGTFSIVDHRNADEMRSVSTLSGGETFLVSLALALSLAETLSRKGGSGLDAIILDEGFGTLDDESLDTVASVLEELTDRGLMVGVITHVKELAARAPTRYEVRREPTGAVVRLAS